MATVNLSGAGVLPSGAPNLTNAGQIVAGPGDVQEPAFVVTYTSASAGASDTVNWFDGTLTLPFTPTAVNAFRIGGTSAGTISIASASTPTNTGVTLTYSATPGGTIVGLIQVFK